MTPPQKGFNFCVAASTRSPGVCCLLGLWAFLALGQLKGNCRGRELVPWGWYQNHVAESKFVHPEGGRVGVPDGSRLVGRQFPPHWGRTPAVACQALYWVLGMPRPNAQPWASLSPRKQSFHTRIVQGFALVLVCPWMMTVSCSGVECVC